MISISRIQTKNLLGPIALLSLLSAATGWTQNIRSDFYVANGIVDAAVVSGNTVYIGGYFTQVGPATGAGVPIDSSSGSPVTGFPKVVGKVSAVTPDGSGGWYIGGTFTAVGGLTRSNLAHILADNSVSAWNPTTDGAVDALAVNGSTVYIGGEFANIGGQPRSQIAAVDATTALATAWNPNADGTIYTLAVNGSTVYAGGSFTHIGGQARNYIAALDATSGLATTWNPNASGGAVHTLAIDATATTVYAGGDFTSIGGQSRNRIAALDSTSGQASMVWNPNASNTVFALALGNGVLYAGGSFTTIGGQQRNHIAEIDVATALPNLSWNPNTNGDVYSLAVSGTSLYVGGQFTNIGSTLVSAGQIRNYIAQLDATGAATGWNPNANNAVNALAVNGSTIYAGGSFTSLGGVQRNFVAALDATTGVVLPWDPSASSAVFALAADSSTVYAGGAFTTIGGQSRNHIAALDPASGSATIWDGNANDFVWALAVDGSTIYAGGWFTNIGGQPRNHIAALDATTALATPWDPNASGPNFLQVEVLALTVSGSTVYAGGTFTSIGGQSRSDLAALDGTTALATAWNPNAAGTVDALALSGSTLYVGGVFSSIGGQTRNDTAALDTTTGLATPFSADTNYRVSAMALSGSNVFAGGSFTTIGGQPRGRIAALDGNSGFVTNWNPDVDAPYPTLFSRPGSQVSALAVSSSLIFVGGNFSSVGNFPNSYFAAISLPVQLSAVGSRKVHGSAGTFDVDLPLTGSPGIECRSGGVSGDYTIIFRFANPLSTVGGASVTSGTGSVVSGNIDSSDAHNYIVNLTGVSNVQYVTVSLTNVTDSAGESSSAVSATMGVLIGDVNASRRVDAADVSLVRQQTLQPITNSNFREDINASGRIDAADVSIARQQTLTSLP